MKKIHFYLVLICIVSTFKNSFAQRNVVSVNPLTGSANVFIPIYNVTNGAASIPISISYTASGVRVKDIEGKPGLGWQLQAGGQISRTMRGLPDDCKTDGNGNARLGWLYNNNGIKISQFQIQNDNNVNTCNDDTQDVNYINNNFGDFSDTEPDIFNLNVPGLSFQFVFDANHQIKPLSYQDIQITFSTDSSTGSIKSFTVINDKGMKYTFADLGVSYRRTSTYDNNPHDLSPPESGIVYFRTAYYQFKNGITYNNSWYLSTITDPNGNSVSITYTDDMSQGGMQPVQLKIGQNSPQSTLYYDYKWDHYKIPSGILSGNGGYEVSMNYFSNSSTSNNILSSINIQNNYSVLFNYDNVSFHDSNANTNYNRAFLRDLTTDQCNSSFNYHFTYYQESSSSNGFTTLLPDSSSTHVDSWGYLNSLGQAGSLAQISYFDQGNTTLNYEPNDFINPATGNYQSGSGIRLQSMVEYDGINSANNIVTTYSYLNAANSTSGRATMLPAYSFLSANPNKDSSATSTDQSTVTSASDFTPDEDYTVLYGYVKESRPGTGSTIYQYQIPATYDDNSVSNWSPTINYAARTSCSSSQASMGVLPSSSTYSYPFTPNTNYDYARGMISQVNQYDDSGNPVSETDYSYQLTNAPVAITALKFDANNSAMSYGKYNLYASTGELTSQVIKKLYDSANHNALKQSITNYSYGTNHKLPVRESMLNSDGITTTTNTLYNKDFTNINQSSSADNYAVYTLQQKNMNVPLEVWVNRTLPNNAVKTVRAALTKYALFTGNNGASNVLPGQQLQFFSADGVTDFSPAEAIPDLQYDNRYVLAENFLQYDPFGILTSASDNHKNHYTIASDLRTHLPVGSFTYANPLEIAYTNFELYNAGGVYMSNINVPTFTKDDGSPNYVSADRSQNLGNSLALEAGGTLSVGLSKSALSNNGIFSLWISSTSTGSITLTILNSSGQQIGNYQLPFANTAGQWKYYELKVPLNVAGLYTVRFSSNQAINIDDVLMYPDIAEAKTVAYNYNTHSKVSETSTNGTSTYYINDKLGRNLQVLDQDKQIVKRQIYSFSNTALNFPSAAFTYSPAAPVAKAQVTFSSINSYTSCAFNGMTGTMDYGDGTPPDNVFLNSSNYISRHNYASAGTYTTTLTLSATGYGTKSTQQTITVGAPPTAATLPISLSYTNQGLGGNFYSVTFSQNGAIVATYYAADLDHGASIPAGFYTVAVTCTGSGYGKLYLNGQDFTACKNYFKSNSYTFNLTLDGGTSLSFNLLNGSCN